MALTANSDLVQIVNGLDVILQRNREQAIASIKRIEKTGTNFDVLSVIALLCIETNKCNILDEIFKNTNLPVNFEISMNSGYITFLHKAIIHQSTECARILIQNGADVNKPSTLFGTYYPIDMATNHLDSHNIITLLLENNAIITYNSAISCLDKPELFSKLIQKAPQHVAQLRGGISNGTLLHYYRLSNINIIGQILDAGYDINAVDNYGRTALHVCTSLNILQLFVERGFALEAMDNEGNTPLLYQAASNNSEENLLFLIQAGSNILTESTDGKDMLLYCIMYKYKNVFNILLERNVNVNKIITMGNGRVTILDLLNDIIEADDEDTAFYTEMRIQLINRGAISAKKTLETNFPTLNENTYKQLPYIHVGRNNTNAISMNTFENDNIVGILPTYKSNNVSRQHRIYKKNHAFKMYNKNTRRLTNTGKYILTKRKSPITRENIQPENIKLYRSRVGNTNALNYGPIGSSNIEFESIPNKANNIRASESVGSRGPNVVECKGSSYFPGFKGLFTRGKKTTKVTPIGGKRYRSKKTNKRK